MRQIIRIEGDTIAPDNYEVDIELFVEDEVERQEVRKFLEVEDAIEVGDKITYNEKGDREGAIVNALIYLYQGNHPNWAKIVDEYYSAVIPHNLEDTDYKQVAIDILEEAIDKLKEEV